MAFTYSADDVARAQVVDAAVWLPCVITDYNEKASKDGSSINHVVDFKVIGEEYKGLPLRKFFSEKAPSAAFGFLNALGANISKDGGTFDFNAARGRNVLVMVVPKDYEGRMTNSVEEFRPMD